MFFRLRLFGPNSFTFPLIILYARDIFLFFSFLFGAKSFMFTFLFLFCKSIFNNNLFGDRSLVIFLFFGCCLVEICFGVIVYFPIFPPLHFFNPSSSFILIILICFILVCILYYYSIYMSA